jgi:hypothetical protein
MKFIPLASLVLSVAFSAAKFEAPPVTEGGRAQALQATYEVLVIAP